MSIDRVVAAPTTDRIAARATLEEEVVSTHRGDQVGTLAAEHRVVPQPGIDRVVAAAGVDEIIA